MTLDLAQFHEAFFSESFEALDSMEAALLELSEGNAGGEQINTIFRVAHSIKGGSATFGFTQVASFTHTLETLLDELRSGRRDVTQPIVDLLLRATDVMREMLGATREKRPLDVVTSAAVHAEVEAILRSPGRASQPTAAVQPPASAEPAAESSGRSERTGWRIRFAPGIDMMRHGNDPLRVLRELSELGGLTVRVDASRLPTLQDLDPEVCFLSWNCELETQSTRQQVDTVFEWAEGECDLSIEPLAGDAAQSRAPTEQSDAVAEPPASVGLNVGTSTGGATETTEVAAPSRLDSTRAGSADGGSIRVRIEKIDELMNAVGEIVITQSVLSQLAAPIDCADADALRNAIAQLERHMRSLQESVMRIRMLPISFLFNRFPRMVRDLGQRLGKKVELRMTGEQTELDKTVLEKIGDPLVHLIRNSIDHGIETPEARLAVGKSESGSVTLNAYHKGGNVIVEVIDDGRGLDAARILAKARERGLVGPEEELPEEKILNLIFMPGFSTAEVVSDVSGRGVGMDVVRRNISEIGGHVQVLSTPGQGSTVRIRLPLTLAILDGQLVRVGKETFVVPIVSIVETIQIRRENIGTMASRIELFRLRDEYIPIIRLYSVFDIMADRTDLIGGLLMIVEADGKRVGLFVDELLAQQQVVIKSLETNFRQVAGISGATMLGDGRVALILDIPGVITQFQQQEAGVLPTPEAA